MIVEINQILYDDVVTTLKCAITARFATSGGSRASPGSIRNECDLRFNNEGDTWPVTDGSICST